MLKDNQFIIGRKFGEMSLVSTEVVNTYANGTPRRKFHLICSCGRKETLWEISARYRKYPRCNQCFRETLSYKRHPLYGTWVQMNKRCYSSTHQAYKDYGGRGVTVCNQWRRTDSREQSVAAFWTFVQDMGERPDKYTLERKNTDGPYAPDNCCWASRAQQRLNQRRRVV